MTLPAFQPRTDWQPPSLGNLPSWAGAKRIAVDIETKDLRLKELGIGCRRGGYIVGVSFAIEDGPSAYLPIAHAGGGNLDSAQVLRYLRDQGQAFNGVIAGANLQYDLDYLEEAGVTFPRAKFFRDVQIAEPLIDDLQMSYSLENIAKRYGVAGKSEEHLAAAAAAFGVDPKKGLWQLPARHVGAYAEQDARLPLQLLRMQERRLEEEDLWGVYDLESRLLPVLLKLRRRGVRFSHDRLAQIESWSKEKENEALHEVTRLTGTYVSPADTNRPAALVPLLVAQGITLPRTDPTEKFPEGQPSMKSEFLKTLDNPVAKAIVQAKRFRKLRDTFVESIREYAIGDRIHTTYNQLRMPREGNDDEENGARYGRVSCVDPNMQQQPARDPEIGPRWRSIYLPEEGGEWAVEDYSQQEPRWLVHFAALIGCNGAREARERYINDPSTDFHQMAAELTGQPRKIAKEINLGVSYGMGGAKLARKLGLPTKWVTSRKTGKMVEVAGDEAQAIMDQFDSRAPFVREFSWKASDSAARNGYVRTVSRRKCRFNRRADGSYEFLHKAGNRVIQGSSGDQTKQAMVDADAAGIRLQLQVHDELDLTVWSRAEADQLSEIMRTCTPCTVPAKVDVEIGPSWGEAA